ncbi:MAG TPA: hypothetical protein VGD81_05175 [Opitutaceae bacterium]
MAPPYRQTLIVLLAGMLLWLLAAQANHYLARLGVQLWFGGLAITFSALRLSLREGLTATFLIGLAVDAVTPVAFGLHAILFALAHIVIYNARARFAREEAVIAVIVALLANLALFLAVSFTQIADSPSPAHTWLRLFVDLIVSQTALTFIGPWFFALQRRALEIAGARLQDDPRRLI